MEVLKHKIICHLAQEQNGREERINNSLEITAHEAWTHEMQKQDTATVHYVVSSSREGRNELLESRSRLMSMISYAITWLKKGGM